MNISLMCCFTLGCPNRRCSRRHSIWTFSFRCQARQQEMRTHLMVSNLLPTSAPHFSIFAACQKSSDEQLIQPKAGMCCRIQQPVESCLGSCGTARFLSLLMPIYTLDYCDCRVSCLHVRHTYKRDLITSVSPLAESKTRKTNPSSLCV